MTPNYPISLHRLDSNHSSGRFIYLSNVPCASWAVLKELLGAQAPAKEVPSAGWSVDVCRQLTVSPSRARGVWLHVEQSAAASAWCRRYKIVSGSGLVWGWVDASDRAISRNGNGNKVYDLGPGLYEWASTWRSCVDHRGWLVVGAAGVEPLTFGADERAQALTAAVVSGVLTLPSAEELWGEVRALCAQGQWHKVTNDLLPLVVSPELRASIEVYCVAQQEQRAVQAAEIKMPELEGSEKQIKWATDLRAARALLVLDAEAVLSRLAQVWPELHMRSAKVLARVAQLRLELENKAQSRWWIDRRTADHTVQAVRDAIGMLRMCSLRGAEGLDRETLETIADAEDRLIQMGNFDEELSA